MVLGSLSEDSTLGVLGLRRKTFKISNQELIIPNSASVLRPPHAVLKLTDTI